MKSLSFLLLFFLSFGIQAQNFDTVNTSDLIFECTKYGGKLPSKQITIFFPVDFWKIIGTQMNYSVSTTDKIKEAMNDYLLFAVLDYKIEGKDITFKSEEEIRKTVVLSDATNTRYYPLLENQIPEQPKYIVNVLKPTMEKLLGQFGDGMRIILFKAPKDKSGVDITKKGAFTLSWNDEVLKWKLPFYSVLPPKYCPEDQELMKGNWNFCPEHGTKLND